MAFGWRIWRCQCRSLKRSYATVAPALDDSRARLGYDFLRLLAHDESFAWCTADRQYRHDARSFPDLERIDCPRAARARPAHLGRGAVFPRAIAAAARVP